MRASDFAQTRQLILLSVGLWLLAVFANTLVLAYPSQMSLSIGQRAVVASLAAPVPGCRILLVGSSPVVFGLRAADLQAATGCRAVNLGALAVAHVLNDHLGNMLAHARAGDTVVLSDRLWTQPSAELPSCEGGSTPRCLMSWFRLAPNLNETLLKLRGATVRRDAFGDLSLFPDLPSDPSRPQDSALDNLAFRLQRIEGQVRAIRASGARPLLAPVPVLVRPESRQMVERDLASLSALVAARVGPGVWLTPIVNTDAAATTLDGQHASPAGRRQWTAQIAAALATP